MRRDKRTKAQRRRIRRLAMNKLQRREVPQMSDATIRAFASIKPATRDDLLKAFSGLPLFRELQNQD